MGQNLESYSPSLPVGGKALCPKRGGRGLGVWGGGRINSGLVPGCCCHCVVAAPCAGLLRRTLSGGECRLFTSLVSFVRWSAVALPLCHSWLLLFFSGPFFRELCDIHIIFCSSTVSLPLRDSGALHLGLMIRSFVTCKCVFSVFQKALP